LDAVKNPKGSLSDLRAQEKQLCGENHREGGEPAGGEANIALDGRSASSFEDTEASVDSDSAADRAMGSAKRRGGAGEVCLLSARHYVKRRRN